MKIKKRSIFIAILAAICIFTLGIASSLVNLTASAEGDRHNVYSTVSQISPGVTETEYYTNNSANDDQVVSYAITVDLSQSTIIAGYKDYDTSGSWGMQTVREQAAAAESARGVNVVAAVNGDFYNMGTGQPTGVLVMNGQVVNNAAGRNYFAILKDGTAVIRTGSLQGDEAEAIGGALMLISDGEIAVVGNDSYYTTKQPRTAVGITADGQVVIVVADGRQSPYSSGYTYVELAEKMLELGCVDAINLDGGGSTTYLAQYSGTDELTLANNPSDGQERSVSSSLLVVSNSEPTGVFGSAIVSPQNEVYTPGSSVEFSAIGADTAGFGMDIPDGAYWQVSSASAVSGEITDMPSETEGEMAAQFVAEEGVTGTAVVELVYEGEVVGSAQIELQWPDTLTMENSQFSLDFSEETDFGLTAYWQTRVVHLKTGDLVWDIGSTGNEEFPSIGKMEGDIFVADAEATNVTATVTASLANNAGVTVSAEVSVGQLPYVLWDFEDITDEEGNVIQTAEEYYSFGEGGNFSISTAGRGEIASAKIVDTSNGEVRVGEHALQINYDLTQAQHNATLGIYFGTSEYFDMPNDFGMPTAFGVWIYVPTEGFNFWLRTWFTGHNEDGTQIPGNSFGSGFGGNFNENDGVALEQGWNYIYVDFSEANSYGVSYYRFGNQMFRMMLVGPSGTYTQGYIYLDNFQFEYGPNTDDLYAPEINSVNINSESGVALSEDEVIDISDDPFYIYASYEEFMGLSDEELAEIENEEVKERYEKASMYATGVNTGNIHVYVDGNEVELGSVNETYLLTSAISLPNGEHEITVEVYDNFQNLATKSYIVNVGNDSNYSGVSLQGSGNSPYLGANYLLDLVADIPESVQEVTFEIRLATGFEIVAGESVAGFTVSRCELTHVNNNIYTVTVTRDGTGTYSGDGVIASFAIPCSTSLIEGSVLSYSVESSLVTYSEGVQENVINSFHAEDSLEVLSYYTIDADTMIVGSEGGYIYVYGPDGVTPAAGVTVTIDGEEIGQTDDDGRIFTDKLVGAAGYKTVAAHSDEGYSYGQRVYGVLAGGAVDESNQPSAEPLYVRAVATTNGNSEQRIVWLSNPLAAENAAVVRYATLADYQANGEAAFVTLDGSSLFIEFSNTYAVYVNQALITGLEQGTEYVYQVGDGSVWSQEVYTFSTSTVSDTTDFFIIGDTQEDNPDAIHAYGNAITNSGIDYDFAIQTGDFVDNGSNYELWSGILSLFTQYFDDTDFVQVFGNHEYEGSDGSYPAAMNFVPDRDYYSVTYGNVYVAVINIYTEEGLNEAIEWIKQDAAESDAVWKVLTLHRPPYYTNISGGSETAHELIPSLVDEVGFDAVFSGHDHSYARTQPMTGGEVDTENGAVYFIVGAAESGRYGIYDDPEFNFAMTSGDYNALYLSVHATDTEMEITVYNLLEDGSFEIFDSYTIRNGCATAGHSYTYVDGRLVCGNCNFSTLPSDIGFSGLVQDEDGRNVFFTDGLPVENQWVSIGENYYYFGEDGFGVDGEQTLQVSYDGNESGDITFVFDNGIKVGGHTGWYGEKYYIDGVFQTGFIEVDGYYYYLWTGEDNNWTGYEYGQRARGYRQIAFHMEAGWTWDTYFWFDETDGHMLGQAYDEDGNMIPGKFYNRVADGQPLYSYLLVEGTGTNVTANLYRMGWITASEYAGEAEGNTYYIRWDNMILGDYELDGVKYKFNPEGSDPLTDGTGALLGRYYDVAFVSEGDTVAEQEVLEGNTIAAPEAPVKAADSTMVESYAFLGWFNGEEQLTEQTTVSGDVTYTASYQKVYSELYDDIAGLLGALQSAQTPSEKHQAVDRMTELYATLTAENISDAEAEGMSFELYEEMLGKLYTVTFTNGGTIVASYTVYEGETVSAPATPAAPAGNSIKSYVFAGWFSGTTQFVPGEVTADGTYSARFTTVYTSEYNTIMRALNALDAARTPAAQRAAIARIQPVYEAMSEQEIADCVAEGLDFGLYLELVEQVYTVSFVADGEVVFTTTALSGETVNAPADPDAPAGNTIKSYVFAGWFSGGTEYTPDLEITGDTTFEAAFETVYTERYERLAEALEAVEAAENGSLDEQYEALTAVYNLLAECSEREIADAEAEGLTFGLYKNMLADYNGAVESGKEDMQKAENAAANFFAAMTAVAALAAVVKFRLGR